MTPLAELVQRAAYLLSLGLIGWESFISYVLALLSANRQRLAVQAELEVIEELDDDTKPLGVLFPDLAERDTKSIRTVLEQMDVRLDRIVSDSKAVSIAVQPQAVTEPQDAIQEHVEPITLGEPDRLTALVEAIEDADEQTAKQEAMKVHKIKFYQFEAEPDACEKCQARDGETYPIKKKAAVHNHCKCRMRVIKFKYREDAA